MSSGHSKQCICQLCTCGRHRCPHDRNKSKIELTDGVTTSELYQRKEYATATSNEYERARPLPRRDEMTLSFTETNRPQSNDFKNGVEATTRLADAYLMRAHRSEHELSRGTARDAAAAAARDRFDTSLRLRERAISSQIDFRLDNREPDAIMRTSYREQSEAVAKSPQPQTRLARPKDGEIDKVLRGNGLANGTITTVNRSEYVPKRVEQSAVKRPTTSDHWKSSGRMDAQSVSRSEYAPKHGEPSKPLRPPGDSDILQRNAREEFARETSNLSDYTQKKVERQVATRPADNEDLFRRDGTIDGITISRVDYSPKRVDRQIPTRPADNEDLFRRDGTIDGITVSKADYSAKKAELQVPKRPTNNEDAFKHDGTMNTISVNRSEYARHTRGDRYDTKRPEPSDLWKRDGQFEANTVTKNEYSQKTGECYQIRKPKDSEIFERNDSPISTTTVNRSEFSPKSGQIHPVRRPRDSEIFDRSGKVDTTTVHKSEYYSKSGILSPRDTAAVRVRAKREHLREAAHEINSDAARVAQKSATAEEFTPKRVERVFGHRPTTSDIWKNEGSMSEHTITRDEFTYKEAESVSPAASRNGALIRADTFTIGKTEDTEDSMFESVSRRDYSTEASGLDTDLSTLSLNRAAEKSAARQRSSQFGDSNRNATFDSHTVYSENYRTVGTSASRPLKVTRPKSALKLSGEHHLTSGYKADFGRKLPEDAAARCLAGELIDSVRHNHVKTRHFEFRKMDNGHHFYEPRRTPPSKQNTPR